MDTKLAGVLASYFTAVNAGDTERVLTHFADDAVVEDERGTPRARRHPSLDAHDDGEVRADQGRTDGGCGEWTRGGRDEHGLRQLQREPGDASIHVHGRAREHRASGDRVMTAQHFAVDGGEFAGKRVLVTGGTQGMGQSIARRLAASGARVATTARSPLPEGQTPNLFVRADVSKAEGVEKVVRTVLDRYGGVDILINNVGGSSAPGGGFAALTDDEWQRALDVNLLAAVRLDRALLPAMLTQARASSCTSRRSSAACRSSRRRSLTPPRRRL